MLTCYVCELQCECTPSYLKFRFPLYFSFCLYFNLNLTPSHVLLCPPLYFSYSFPSLVGRVVPYVTLKSLHWFQSSVVQVLCNDRDDHNNPNYKYLKDKHPPASANLFQLLHLVCILLWTYFKTKCNFENEFSKLFSKRLSNTFYWCILTWHINTPIMIILKVLAIKCSMTLMKQVFFSATDSKIWDTHVLIFT